MSSPKNNAAQPGISLSQLNSGSLGDINNSVNLFRGDVNFPFNLVSLPGRNGLDVSIKAFYQSNVERFVQQWNMEAPTDILGVGWSIPCERVVLSTQNTGSGYDDDYFLIAGGNSIPLIRKGSVEKNFGKQKATQMTPARFLILTSNLRMTTLVF